MAYRNRSDKDGDDSKKGGEAEVYFGKRFEEVLGIKPVRANSYRDKVEHVDYDAKIIGKDGSVHVGSWDVKACKEGVDKGIICIEFVSYGNLGWIYGKAKWIAFLMPCGKFLCVNREDLVEMCERKCWASFVVNKNDALYKMLVRWHLNEKTGGWSNDIVTYVTTRDLFSLEHWKL